MHLSILVPRGRAPFGQHQEITTSGLVQRLSVFEWLCEHNRLKPEPIRFGLPVLDLARGRDFLVLTKRSAASDRTRMAFILFVQEVQTIDWH